MLEAGETEVLAPITATTLQIMLVEVDQVTAHGTKPPQVDQILVDVGEETHRVIAAANQAISPMHVQTKGLN